jgi:hypothetical protein
MTADQILQHFISLAITREVPLVSLIGRNRPSFVFDGQVQMLGEVPTSALHAEVLGLALDEIKSDPSLLV